MKKHLHDYINSSKSHSVRGLRFLLEYFYALEVFEPLHDPSLNVVSVFGSARCKPGNSDYDKAVKLGEHLYDNGFAVVTGASQGIMEAANKGVAQGILKQLKSKAKFKSKSNAEIEKSSEFQKILKNYSLGLKISLPFESEHNPHLGTVATFHYFMVRKFFFAKLSSAFIACEGGWGTRDELFEIMTLVQTGKAPLMPIIYISDTPAHLTDDLEYSVRKKYVSEEDLYLIQVVPDFKKAVSIISKFYGVVKSVSYDRENQIDIELAKPLTQSQKQKVQKLVDGQYKNIFTGGVQFTARKMIFKDCIHKSYGILRHVIDSIS